MEDESVKLLLIEDSPSDARLVREMLSDASPGPFDLECADRLCTGLARLTNGDIDVVLLDLALPDSFGLGTFFKVHAHTPQAAIVVLTSLNDEEVAVQAVREGAQDYLVKGRVSGEQLARAVVYAKQRKQAEKAIHQRSRELATLNVITQSLGKSVRVNDALQDALCTTLDAAGLAAGSIHLLDDDAGELVLAAHRGLNQHDIKSISHMPVGVGAPGRAVETGSVVVSMGSACNSPSDDGNGAAPDVLKTGALVSAPLRARGRIVGVITGARLGSGGFSEGETQLLARVGCQIGSAIENARVVEKARNMSLTDGLTGLPNRRHFERVLEVEISRAQRTGRSFCLAFLDIDGFRQYNGMFGHTNGDKLLKSLSQTLKSSLRKVDIVFRMGPDEFAVVLPATDALRAKKALGRVRVTWTRMHQAHSRALDAPLSFSSGIAQFPEDAGTADRLVSLADNALHWSKYNGGHQSTVVTATVSPLAGERRRAAV